MTVQEKIETRNKLLEEARGLNDLAQKEERDFNDEERASYDAKIAEIDKLSRDINAEKRSQTLAGFTNEKPAEEAESRAAENDEGAEFRSFLMNEKRAGDSILSVGENGGALAPQAFVNEIIKGVEDETPILQKVNVVHLAKAASIGVPYESSDATDADFTNEIPASDITEDKSLAYAKRELGAHQLMKLIKVSNKLLKTSAFDVAKIVSDKLISKNSATIEKAIVAGTGTNQPLGIFNSASKVNEVEFDGADITADDLVKLERGIKSAYRKNGVFIVNPAVATKLMLLKDNDGQYIWRSGLVAGNPDTLLGHPVIESDYAPTSFAAAGDYAMAFGDLSKYWLTMVDNIEVKTLYEKFSLTGQTGYLTTTWADGQVVLPEAFAVLKKA